MLTLLHLGIKNIRLGPTLPPFIESTHKRLLLVLCFDTPIRRRLQSMLLMSGHPEKRRKLLASTTQHLYLNIRFMARCYNNLSKPGNRQRKDRSGL